jgi:Mg-chelatase subunit ChlD
LLALLLTLGLLVFAAWWYSVDFRWPPWVDYKGLIATAEEDERALRERIAALEADIAKEIEKCRLNDRLAAAAAAETELRGRIEALNALVIQELTLCPLREKVRAAQADGAALDAEAAALADRIAKELEECRRKAEDERRADEKKRRDEEERKRKAEAAPPAKTKPPAKEKAGLQPCPGERAPEEAPDVAIVLDSSGSMRAPASSDRRAAQQMTQQMMEQVLRGLFRMPGGGGMPQNQGPTRLQAAQQASTKVVKGLPSDVDVGLVVLQNCPRASNQGFYPGSRRGQLYQRINSLRPQNGTPLADGVEQAGQMVDGVRAPAVIVVVSDGEDSCNQDPCAVARSLKARKPRVTINVVDIVGDGYANCLAQLTGGKILTPKSGMAFESTIKQATGEAQKPAHCK